MGKRLRIDWVRNGFKDIDATDTDIYRTNGSMIAVICFLAIVILVTSAFIEREIISNEPRPSAIISYREFQTNTSDNVSLPVSIPFYKRHQNSCESILEHATFRPEDNSNTSECTLRTFSYDDFQSCVSKRSKKPYILFFGDSRVRYKYRHFSVNYVQPGIASEDNCSELPDPLPASWREGRLHNRDFSCNSTSVTSVFWWQRYIDGELLDRLKAIPPTQRPDIVAGSVWPWYCYRGINDVPSYQKNLSDFVNVLATWENTTILYFKQEPTLSDRKSGICKEYMLKVFNALNSWQFKTPPKNVKYMKSPYDFQVQFGNRNNGLDFLHVNEAADMWTSTLMLNYICNENSTHYGEDDTYCC